MNNTDIFNIGTLNKPIIWSTYVTLNIIGIILCILLIRYLLIKHNKSSSDIFIIGLCSGCIWMSITCAGECLLSVINNEFYGSNLACWIEALFHVSGILVQFFNVTLLNLRNYLIIIKLKSDISINSSILIVIIVWFISVVGTIIFGIFSPIYLVSNGTYCFYEFKSLAILGWLVSMLLLSIIIMIFVAINIFIYLRKHTKNIEKFSSNNSNYDTNLHIKTLKRNLLFICVIFIGWHMAGVSALYEYFYNTATENMVTAVGVFGTWHTVAVPLAYGYVNGTFSFLKCIKLHKHEDNRNGQRVTIYNLERLSIDNKTTENKISYAWSDS